MASCEMHGGCQVHDRLVCCLKLIAGQKASEMNSNAEDVMEVPNLYQAV